jgi:tripartite-type tricarboxylate transporter receptor subunit TctC
MIEKMWHVCVFAFVAYAVCASHSAAKKRGAEYPQKPIKVIVPFNPGGGTDTFVRFINKAIKDQKLMPHSLVVVNKPGGATTIGSSYVKYSKPDGYTILCLHEALMTTKATGQSPHGPDSFEPIAATGEEGQMILVKTNSPFKDLKDFVKAAEKEPNTIKFGVNLNAPPHFSGIMLEDASNGAKFRFVPTGGASKRLSALEGGHVDAAIFTVSEYIRYREMGLRALAYLGEERHPSKEISSVPTGGEQGYPVVNSNLQYWWFPKGTDQQIIDYFTEVLRKAMKSSYVLENLDRLKIIPRVITGEDLHERVEAKMKDFNEMKVEKQIELPNLTNWTLGMIALFLVIVIARFFLKKGIKEEQEKLDFKVRNDLAIGVVFMTLAYAVFLSLHLIDFRLATAIYVFAAGFYLTKFDKSKLVYTLEISLLMSLGLFFVFTELFLIELP